MEGGKSFFIETYGCEMNKSDSVDIALSFEEHGYFRVSSAQKADVIILNTCSVREHAEDRIIGRLGYCRAFSSRRRGDAVIIFAGCMAQEQGRRIMGLFPEVKVVAGTYHFLDLPQLLHEYERTSLPVLAVEMEQYHFSPHRGLRAEGHRAWVNIITGCSNHCSYCIVPHLRGREISKGSDEVVNEIAELVRSGVVEVTLLGQNVNAYGNDSGDISFVELLEMVNDIEGLRWIRFLTSHPKDFNPELVKRLSRLSKVCRHFHLPLQSGSDHILSLMNRGYTMAHYRAVVDAIREYMPDSAITTDIIVGFPSESEEEFKQTLRAMESIGFDDAFTYRYSKRPMTKAASLADQVHTDIARQRLVELIKLQRSISMSKSMEEIGKRVTLLVERQSKKSREEFLCRSEKNKMVVVRTKRPAGSFINARIEGILGNTLRGVELFVFIILIFFYIFWAGTSGFAEENSLYFLLPGDVAERYLPSGEHYLIPEDDRIAGLLDRARGFEEKQNYRQASRYYLLASRRVRGGTAAPYLIFKHCSLQESIDASIECLQNIIRTYPDFPLIEGVWFELAVRQYLKEEYGPALRSLEVIVEAEKERNRIFTPYVYTFMGIVRSMQGDEEGALVDYTRSLAILSYFHEKGEEGGIMRSYLEMARSYVKLGRHGEAEGLLKRIYGTSTSTLMQAETLVLLGELYEQSGQALPASAAYGRLLADYPDTLQALQASRALQRLGTKGADYSTYTISGIYDRRLLLGVYGTGISEEVPGAVQPGYVLQIGAFSGEQNALKLVKELKGKGYPAYSIKASIGEKEVFRVRIGPYKTRSEAEPVLKELEGLGYRGLVLREE